MHGFFRSAAECIDLTLRLFVVDFVVLIEAKGFLVCGKLDFEVAYPRRGGSVEVRRRDGTRRVTTVTNCPCDPRPKYAEIMLRGIVSYDDIAVGDEVWTWDAEAERYSVKLT